MLKKAYCSNRHGRPNGGVPGYDITCGHCGALGHSFDWYCKECFRCMDCGRVIKKRYELVKDELVKEE